MSVHERGTAAVVETAAHRRAGFFFILFSLLFGALLFRLYDLQIVQHAAFAAHEYAQSHGSTESRHIRGGIRTADGLIMATSVAVPSVWADPLAVEERDVVARTLAAALSIPVATVAEKLDKKLEPLHFVCRDHPKAAVTDRTCPLCHKPLVLARPEFVWIKRKVTEEEAKRIADLASQELMALKKRDPRSRARVPYGLEIEFDRRYPCGELASHVLGIVNESVASVWAKPSLIADRVAAARVLAPLLSMTPEAVSNRLNRSDQDLVLVKRNVGTHEISEIRRLARSGELPPGSIGVVDDELGCEGVERATDVWLGGRSERHEVALDGRRQLLEAPDWDSLGAEVTLTLNSALQKIVEEEIEAAAIEFHPKWIVAVGMDPRTGEILALANLPTFDPNEPTRADHPRNRALARYVPSAAELRRNPHLTAEDLCHANARRDRALTDPFEPGSTFKPFVVSWALENKVVSPQTRINCENGILRYGPRLLHDHHPYSMLTVLEVVSLSSNIGAVKIGLMLGRQRMYEAARAFGFGRPTGIDLPAENGGRLFPLARWTIYSDTSVPMGHEVAVTPLQLVTGMSAIVNGGWVMRPYVISRVAGEDGTLLYEGRPQRLRRILCDATCDQMREILKDVMVKGTGKKVEKIDGLVLGGKTGTTQKIDPLTHQYTHEKYIASFVGFAPADAARLVVAVIVDEPQGTSYYGGAVAAPVAQRIFKRGMAFVK